MSFYSTKSIFKSKTFWGGIIAVIAPVLAAFGIEFPEEARQALLEVILAVVGLVGIIWGRVKADTRVRL